MKRLLFAALLAVFALATQAQEHFLFRLGGGVSSHYGLHSKNMNAFCVGLGYEYEFSQKWSVSPSVLYFARGWKEPDKTVPARDDNGDFVYDENDGHQIFGKKGVKSHSNYVQVPVMFNYYIHLKSPHYVSLSAGPYVACGVGGKTETYGDTDRFGAERLYYEQDTFGDEVDARRFDAGVSLAVGYEYNRNINLAFNADFGLLKVSKAGGKNKCFYLSFMYRL